MQKRVVRGGVKYIMELSELLDHIRMGHVFLVICCAFYLVWWSITFNPMRSFTALPKYILFFCTFISGAIGGIYLIPSLGKLPVVNRTISNLIIMAAGVAAYALLLFLTSHFLHRQVTTELFLIIGWTVLELCMLASVYGADVISTSYAIIMSVVVVVAAVISMVCYLCYYDIDPVIAFYDGMVPLILFGIVMTVQAILIKPALVS